MDRFAVVYKFHMGDRMDSVAEMLIQKGFYNKYPFSKAIYDKEGEKFPSGFIALRHPRLLPLGMPEDVVFVEANVGTRLEKFLSEYQPSEAKG